MNHTTHSCLQGRTAVIGAARRTVCTVLVAAALATGLSACAPLIVGGAVVGGVMAALVAVKREEAMAKEALEAAEEDMVLIVSRLKTRSTFLVYQEI